MNKMQIEFVPMETADAAAVARLEAEYFSQPWSEQAFIDAAKRSDAIYLCAKYNQEIVGYCGLWKVLDEGEITNVSVDIRYRQRSIARKMMEELLFIAEKEGVSSFFLEVRKSNQAARILYEKLGFRHIQTRKNFYQKPAEDALIMQKEIH